MNNFDLLLLQFSRPVLLSNLLAWPVVYIYTSRWLAGFQSHIDLSMTSFIGAALLTLGIALLTVFTHALIAAGINPVNALRYE